MKTENLKLATMWAVETFQHVGEYITSQKSASIGQYIMDNAEMLHFLIISNYNFFIKWEITETVIDPETGAVQKDGVFEIAEHVVDMYYDSWQKLLDLFNKEYNPLSTKEITEKETQSGEDTYTRDVKDTGTSSGTNTYNNVTSVNSQTTYDSTAYRPVSKNENSGGTSAESTANTTQDRDDSTKYGKVTEWETSGNAGYVPTQNLFREEMKLRADYHLEDLIVANIVDSCISGTALPSYVEKDGVNVNANDYYELY